MNLGTPQDWNVVRTPKGRDVDRLDRGLFPRAVGEVGLYSRVAHAEPIVCKMFSMPRLQRIFRWTSHNLGARACIAVAWAGRGSEGL
jgi:hypothetical protein